MARRDLILTLGIGPNVCADLVLVLNILRGSSDQNQLQCAENMSWHKSNLARN